MKNLKFIVKTIVFVFVASMLTITATHAETPKGGLFINLTTNDDRAATKAIMFAHKKVLKNGYKPVAIWLNVNGIYLADKRRASRKIQTMLKAFAKDGGIVIACNACSKAVGLKRVDLADGVKMGNAKLVLGLLFDPMIKTLSW